MSNLALGFWILVGFLALAWWVAPLAWPGKDKAPAVEPEAVTYKPEVWQRKKTVLGFSRWLPHEEHTTAKLTVWRPFKPHRFAVTHGKGEWFVEGVSIQATCQLANAGVGCAVPIELLEGMVDWRSVELSTAIELHLVHRSQLPGYEGEYDGKSSLVGFAIYGTELRKT